MTSALTALRASLLPPAAAHTRRRAVAERVLTNPNASAEQRRAAEAEIAMLEGERE